ncbi:hypothetical protein Pmar_PMAR021542 [Perkinsus marinus ATCC 50983]|uniref:F-box domain-containing protein n=1 Tax=Perkinsus marinus (strain ATCC 50983 / TXsc) TaxID=423536 RepID=C5LEH9_PERM5|nr:hypothetical protein Pmar_PMAR021542 [Perkinsus marinus ATCC 50983]EER04864.1 hypothetical protein Pmar_PMAR021542 [Perkinsus marinus ATCC 50983]|eukprot:XP_002773048.1 hypothetical protein Pmar_PMAR021542 [Perkinsus marinus ATCC 50983]
MSIKDPIRRPTGSLSELPPEVLARIGGFCSTGRWGGLRALSSTNRGINAAILPCLQKEWQRERPCDRCGAIFRLSDNTSNECSYHPQGYEDNLEVTGGNYLQFTRTYLCCGRSLDSSGYTEGCTAGPHVSITPKRNRIRNQSWVKRRKHYARERNRLYSTSTAASLGTPRAPKLEEPLLVGS